MEVENIIISNNIKKYRALTGLLQSEVASKIGVSCKTYNLMENNPIKYSLLDLKVLADFYKCKISDFFVNIEVANSDN